MEPKVDKVLIISLDGATWSVLNPLISQGCMPNLGTLMTDSVSSELESVVPPVTAPAWTSFMTGKHPNKHGVFDFAKFNPEYNNWTINNSTDVRSKTIWQILSAANKRVIVLNLPYTYPLYKINGVMVAGWDAPLTDAPFSYPAEVGREILDEFPDYKQNLWVSELRPLLSDDQFDEFTRRLKNGIEQQAKIAMNLMGREEWDVLMVHFQQTDWIQHKLWTYIERACGDVSDSSPKIAATRECYRHFDKCVGQVLKQAETDQPLIVLLSDHGFGRLLGNIPGNSYLKRWGYLSVLPGSQERLGGVKKLIKQSKFPAVRALYRAAASTKKQLNNASLGQQHDSWADNAQNVMSSRAATWDWTRTKAAMVYAYQMGFIYVNVAGRGPHGVVQPGAEYESLVSDLIERCKRDIRHEGTGEPLLQDVIRGVEIYPAADNGVLVPDVVLIPRDGYNFSFSLTEAAPHISEEGTHRHNGVLVMKGAMLRKPEVDFRPELIDLAPTILHVLGLAVPRDMDGKVLQDILPQHWQARYEQADESDTEVMESYTPDEENLIAQRLKGLGYLE